MGRAEFFAKHPGVIAAISGIPIIDNGYLCGMEGCQTARLNRRSLKDHCKEAHKDDSKAYKTFSRGPYQAVFGASSQHSRIIAVANDQNSAERVAAFMKSIPPPIPQKLSDTSEAGVSPFLRLTRWHTFLKMFEEGSKPGSVKAYVALCHTNRVNMPEELKWLRGIVKSYCESIVPVLRSGGHLARRIINTKK
jgi:hypothetical protein